MSEKLTPSTTFALLDAVAKAAVDDAKAAALSILKDVEEHERGEVHNLTRLVDLLFRLRDYNDEIESARKTVVEELKAGPTAIDTYCRDVRKSVDSAIEATETSLFRLMKKYETRLLVVPDGTAELKPKFTVTVEDMAQVPRQFLVPDVRMLEAAAAAGVASIPGCKIESTSALSTRRNPRRKK